MTTWGWRARSIANWTIAALVALGLGALFVFSVYFINGRRQAVVIQTLQLKVGDCIQEWWGGTVLPPVVRKTRCDGPHFGEVFAILTVPDTQDYPGEVALKRFGDNCGHKFFDYAPDIPDGPTFKVAAGFPNEQAWANRDRSVVCAAISKGERWSSIRD